MPDRPAPTWLVRRDRASRVLPWAWICTTHITLPDGLTTICPGRGDTRTKDAAETAARAHATTHTH